MDKYERFVSLRWVRGVAGILLLIVTLFATSGCASLMLPVKVQPDLSYKQERYTELQSISVDKQDNDILFVTQDIACRLPLYSRDEKSVYDALNNGVLPSDVNIYTAPFSSCTAEMALDQGSGDDPTQQVNTDNGSILRLIRGDIVEAPEMPLPLQFAIAEHQTARLYEPTIMSLTQYFALKTLALSAGVAIDSAIFSSSLGNTEKVYAELVTGYLIICFGQWGQGFCQ